MYRKFFCIFKNKGDIHSGNEKIEFLCPFIPLYSNLNIDQDLSEDDAGDSLDFDTDEINNIYDTMEIASEVDNDNDHSIVDTHDFDVKIVPTVHKNISWSRTTSL